MRSCLTTDNVGYILEVDTGQWTQDLVKAKYSISVCINTQAILYRTGVKPLHMSR